jgi:uncharacterized iron-regulated membrane protein
MIVSINWRIGMRKTHRWGASVVAIPFVFVIVTGIILQLKKDWAWVQPPTAKSPSARGKDKAPQVSFDAILRAAQSIPEAKVKTWDDIDRLDVRPDRGIVKVQARNRWEVQVDLATGETLQVAYRRSDLIESLHDGSWFGDPVKLWIFLPVALIVFGLWVTGVYLFWLPYFVRWSRARSSATPANAPAETEK